MNEQVRYFAPLTGVRALAAFMVFLHHYNPIPTDYSFLHNILRECHIGVTLFFVLSGFLITHRYYDRTETSLGRYLVNRFARIYPLYFILTSLTFVLKGLHHEGTVQLYLLNITFLKGFFDDLKFTGIGPGWSLTVEESFYLLAPMLFLLIRRNKKYLFFLPCFFLTLGVLLVVLFRNPEAPGFFTSFNFMLIYTFFGRCAEFFVGIALALLCRSNFVVNFRLFTYAGIGGLATCLVTLSMLAGENTLGIQHPLGLAINHLVLPVAGISLFYYGLIKEETWVGKILASKPMVLLGKSSYAFYLIHVGVFATAINSRLSNPEIFLLALVGISIILYKALEEPLNTLLRRKLDLD